MAPKKKTAASKAKPAQETKPEEALPGEEAPKAEEDQAKEAPKNGQPPKEIAKSDDKEAQMSGANDDAAPQSEQPKSETKAASKKRKAPPSVPREASRKSARGGSKSEPSKIQLLNYLLSKDAEDLCRPDDEKKDLESRAKGARTYTSSVMNPFEELLCSIVLSRPISHMLGLRTIRTILNPPYDFTSAKKVQDAGSEKQHQALWDARTQHKDKTAQQLGSAADVILSKFTADGDKEGTQLGKVLSRDDVDDALEELKTEIKGFGKTGMEIFLRRVQWIWTEAFPFIDGRSADCLRDMGLPQNGEELEKLINEHWKELKTGGVAGDDEAAKKRRVFVVILERATGAELEKKLSEAMEAAANAS